MMHASAASSSHATAETGARSNVAAVALRSASSCQRHLSRYMAGSSSRWAGCSAIVGNTVVRAVGKPAAANASSACGMRAIIVDFLTAAH